MQNGFYLSGRQDLNLRPHAPQTCALPGCATSRTKHLPSVICHLSTVNCQLSTVNSKWAANIGGKRNFQVILHKILPPLHEDTCKAGGYCRS